MVIRNDKLGGTDFPTPTARVKPTDLNDTNDAIVDLSKIRRNEFSGFGFGSFLFVGTTYTNAFNCGLFENTFKSKQNLSYTFETTNSVYSGLNFSSGAMNNEITVFNCGNGTSDILDNFDDGTVPTFWTVTASGSYYNTEADGFWNFGFNQTAITTELSAVSGDIIGTNRTLIIPMNVIHNVEANASPQNISISLGNAIDGYTNILSESLSNGGSSSRDIILKISVQTNSAYWELIGYKSSAIVLDSGTIDTTSYGSLSIRMTGDGSDSSDNHGIGFSLYGVYTLASSPTSTAFGTISNDGGTIYDTIGPAGNISFTAADSNLKLKYTGVAASGECVWITNGLFERID